MEATTAMTSNWWSPIACPKSVSLTKKDLKKILTAIGDTFMIGLAASLVILIVIVCEAPYLLRVDFTEIENVVNPVVFIALFIAFVFILEFVIKTLIRIKQYLLDAISGVKQVGMIKIISKYEINEKDREGHYLKFVWQSESNQAEIDIEHPAMFGLLEVGDEVYLELLPNSKEVLVFRKA